MPRILEDYIRFTRIAKFLIFQTNRDNPMSRKEIVSELERQDIYVTVDVLKDYIYNLNQAGIIINELPADKEHRAIRYYSAISLSPETYLTAAYLVASSGAISIDSSNSIIQSLLSFAPETLMNQFKQTGSFNNVVKKQHDETTRNLSVIMQAMISVKQVSFKSFDIRYDGKKDYHCNGNPYVADPLAVLPKNSRLYLWCNVHIREKTYERFIRLDFIEEMELTSNSIDEKAVSKYRDSSGEIHSVFSQVDVMKESVNIEFHSKFLRRVLDRYGYDLPIDKIKSLEDGDLLQAEIKSIVDKSLFTWIMEGENLIQIVGPEWVLNNETAYIEEVMLRNREKRRRMRNEESSTGVDKAANNSVSI